MASDLDPPHVRFVDRPGLKVQVQWEPRDMWIGVFWRTTKVAVHVYACLLPCCPLHITWKRQAMADRDEGKAD